MNEEIREYLNKPNPDFDAGFSLFCRYSRNQSMMSWIGRKKDMERLLYELAKLEKQNLPVNPQASVMNTRYNTPGNVRLGVPVTGPGPQISFKTFDERRTRRADLSEEMQKVYDDITEEYKLRRGYHEKLKMAKTDADRASLRERLLISQHKIEQGWKQIDAWLLEQEKNKSEKSFNVSSYRAYITKMLKKADSLTPLQRDTVRTRAKALPDSGEVHGRRHHRVLRRTVIVDHRVVLRQHPAQPVPSGQQHSQAAVFQLHKLLRHELRSFYRNCSFQQSH